MDVQIKAKNLKVNEELRAFIQSRVGKLDRFLSEGAEAKLELNYEHPRTGGERTIAQLTVAHRQTILRAEEQHADSRRAIDMAVDTMMTQIRRYHSKRTDRSKRPSVAEFVTLPELAAAELAELDAAIDNTDDGEGLEIVRRKRFALKPMTSGEAIDQLELLGHDFFVFHNAEENQINVVYRRKRGDYGLIQPE
jgi:putative sigma-54 modulation protein